MCVKYIQFSLGLETQIFYIRKKEEQFKKTNETDFANAKQQWNSIDELYQMTNALFSRGMSKSIN